MLYLVTGGSGSGKSEYAENLAVALRERRQGNKISAAGGLYYVAAMYPCDRESQERIARHRLMRRDKGFSTIECYCGIESVCACEKDVLLVECMSNLLANEMYLPEGRIRDRGNRAWEEMEESMVKPLLELAGRAGDLVVVTNEIFSDGMRYDAESELYRALLGSLNIRLASEAAAVVEAVFTIPVVHKGGAYL